MLPALLGFLLTADLAAGGCPGELFRIERSKNANVVLYEAKPGRGAPLDPDEPVTASWLLLASTGAREPLTFFERLFAYGFDVRREPKGPGFSLTLKALRERVIHVAARGACPAATAVIDGREGQLKRIYVQADDAVPPTVAYVELFGVVPETGEALHEKVRRP